MSLTKKQVEESLSIDTDKPVSRQDEHITTTTVVVYSGGVIADASLDVPEHLPPGIAHRPER